MPAVLKKIKRYLPSAHEARIQRAYAFAKEAHAGQKRMDGSDYITHPLEVTSILADLHVDEDTLIASLLHDVSEDTLYTQEDIEKRFGKTVGFLVEGVTKLSKVKYRDNMAERQIESLKKFFLHSARDFRILLIKLADRVHNMSTLEFVRPDKQYRIAKETMEIYVPIANLLGLWALKTTLENLSFRYLYPGEYDTLHALVQQTEPMRQKLLKDTLNRVKRELKKQQVHAELEARPKSFYSLFKKMADPSHPIQDLNELLSIRLIVQDRATCYQALGILHTLFKPKSGRFKDYIAVPKANGYQSLHTTVFGMEGTLTEFQIRTREMHLESEYGIAAHYFNSHGNEATPWSRFQKDLKKKSAWVQEVLELQKELKNNSDFLENLKVDVLQDRIFVFTPHGDVIDLPEGANGIDFAYHIHSDVGDHAIGITRNGQPVALHMPLKTGDTAKVMISKTQHFPPRDWLDKARTNLTRNKIKQSLKRQNAEESVQSGLLYFNKIMSPYGTTDASLSAAQRKSLAAQFETESWSDFLEKLGRGAFDEDQLIESLHQKVEVLGTPYRTNGEHESAMSKIPYRNNGGRLLIPNQLHSTCFYRIHLLIECKDRVGLLRDIGIEFANLGVNIYQITVENSDEGELTRILLLIEVMDYPQLRRVFEALEAIEGIVSFKRLPHEAPAASSADRKGTSSGRS